ncbi:MAG: isochorismatase family cysteine hydrolase [Verrucomicrobiota bacterium]
MSIRKTRKRPVGKNGKASRTGGPVKKLRNGRHLNVDPLKTVYHDRVVDAPEHFQHLITGSTALLCIDLQYLDAARGHGIFKDAATSGVAIEAQEYYFDRLESTVVPNIQRLQASFREHGLEVVHTRIQALTADGRDRSPGHKRLGILAPPGSKEADFLREIRPEGDEIVVNKTASGVFNSTNLDYVLDNLGVSALFIVGVYTNECVETTVRDASDLGYLVTVVEDCCATVTPKLHEASLATLRDRYARVITAKEALGDLEHFGLRQFDATPAR